ncbi:xanthine/uracil permease [Anaeramoeba ignava]|uniref:Xanthine/uracil permease n=1 Tax=Anaeramoeba ignava TaxID=1746090 RepID=A0A9Q0R6P8_ANAIG|nr:xanthine/uracil permease [Anaeramoeba ignava]
MDLDQNEYNLLPNEQNDSQTNQKSQNKKLKLLDRLFHISERNSSLKFEIIGGFIMFFTFLNSRSVLLNNSSLCNMEKGSFSIAISLTSGIATMVSGFLIPIPLTIAPGDEENNFFQRKLCDAYGLQWKTALSVVFIQGILSIFLSLLFLWKMKVVRQISVYLQIGIVFGVALYIGKIGLNDIASLDDEQRVTLDIPLIIGFLAMISLVFGNSRSWNFIFIIYVFLFTIVDVVIKVIRKKFDLESWDNTINNSAFALNFHFKNAHFLYLIFVVGFDVLINSIFTFSATIQILGFSQSKIEPSDFIDKFSDHFEQNIHLLRRALLITSISSSVGSLFGATPTKIIIQSVAGAAVGGKTGLASVICGVLTLLTAPLMPLIDLVPQYVISPLLLFTASKLLAIVRYIDFHDVLHIFPTFLITILIPILRSISVGFASGYVVFAILSPIFEKKISLIRSLLGLFCLLRILFQAITLKYEN